MKLMAVLALTAGLAAAPLIQNDTLDASYAQRYETAAFVSKAYQKRVSDLVAAIARKYGLSRRFSETGRPNRTRFSTRFSSQRSSTVVSPFTMSSFVE